MIEKHLADHRRLADVPGDDADHPAGGQDDRQLQEEEDGQLEVAHGLRRRR
jgi:hypothetical protein